MACGRWPAYVARLGFRYSLAPVNYDVQAVACVCSKVGFQTSCGGLRVWQGGVLDVVAVACVCSRLGFRHNLARVNYSVRVVACVFATRCNTICNPF